jgi:hypothetical protein
MTAISEKPFCVVCSEVSHTETNKPKFFKVCSKKCEKELWKCLGIVYDESEKKEKTELLNRDIKKRLSTVDEENIIKAVIK